MLLSLGRLSFRELWISYQLFLTLAVFGIIGIAAPLLAWVSWLADPSIEVDPAVRGLVWYGLALTGASPIVAAIAARSIAMDRVRGTAAWVLAAPVSRATFFLGWLVGVTGVVVAGMALSGVTAWFTVAALGGMPDPVRFVVAVVASTVYQLAAATLGLLFGSALPRRQAAIMAIAVVGMLAFAAWFLPLEPWLPSSAAAHFAELVIVPEAMGLTVQVIGGSLLAIVVAGYLGTLVIDRAEL